MKIDTKSLKREKFLKEKDFDRYTVAEKNFLKNQGIINGVGPEWMWYPIRWLMTKLFKFLEFPRHDVAFWKGGTIKDFHIANWGILKYSFISIAEDYRNICKDKWYKRLYRLPKYYITLPFKAWIISLAYNACEKGGKSAFNFHR